VLKSYPPQGVAVMLTFFLAEPLAFQAYLLALLKNQGNWHIHLKQ